jgi:translocation protein SEC63
MISDMIPVHYVLMLRLLTWQGLQMGIALPEFLLNVHGASGGILLLGIVGVCILLPLMTAVIYLSRSSKYTGNHVMHQTLSSYYYFMKPSLAPRFAF